MVNQKRELAIKNKSRARKITNGNAGMKMALSEKLKMVPVKQR